MRYPVLTDGEEVEIPRRAGWRIACCNCGLVHKLTFVTRGGKLFARAQRLNRSTAMVRRWREKKESIEKELAITYAQKLNLSTAMARRWRKKKEKS